MKNRADIYNFDRTLASTLSNIAASSLSQGDKDILLRFSNHLFATGISKGRVIKYLYHLQKTAELLGISFPEAGREDIERVVRSIECRTDFTNYTKRDYKIVIRRFYMWLRGTEDYPEEVRWIRKNCGRSNKLLPAELLTKEEVKRMVQTADHPRDKALVFVLYESGCRIGELLTLKIKNVQFDQYGAVMIVNGKTGSRRVRIIASSQPLLNWMNLHPLRDDPDSPLWIRIGNNKDRSMLSYGAFVNRLKYIAKIAGIRKRTYPHLFRHSRATHLANSLTEAQMKQYFGWVQASEMASTYVHLSGRDVDKALLKLNGIEFPEEVKEDTLMSLTCPRCNNTSSPDSKFCSTCGFCMDVKTSIEVERTRVKIDSLMSALVQNPKVLDTLVEAVQNST